MSNMEEIYLFLFANICFLIKTHKNRYSGYFNFISNILFSFFLFSFYLQTGLELLLYISCLLYIGTMVNLLVPNFSFLVFLLLSDFKVNTLLLFYGITIKRNFCPETAEKAIVLLNMSTRYKRALALNEKLLKFKRTTKVLNHKLYALLRIGDYNAANTVIDEILEQNHTNSYYLTVKADIAFYLKEYQSAADYYEKVLYFKPHSLEIIYNLSKALFELEKYNDSEKNLNIAISMNPFYIPAYIQLVKLYIKQDLKSQAIKVLNEIKGKIPEGSTELQQEINNLFNKAEQM